MKNLKLELFNFKKSLTFDQSDVSYIIEGFLNNYVDFAEKQIIQSLNERLTPFTYDKDVKLFLESLNNDVAQYQLLYELKSLYNVLNTKNQGELYRQPINVLLQTINLETDQDRLSKILNELAIYDWVPEIKLFVHNLTKSPEKRNNLLNGGKAESVYTIVEQVEDGHLSFIKDSWFILTDGVIEKTLLENHVKDEERFRCLRTLQTALQYCVISESRIDFRISEYLTVGLGVSNGSLYINEDELNEESTLENIFSSPIIPIVNKNFYPLIMEVHNNLDSFVELDVVKRVTNLINPTLEVYAFNYKNNLFIYRCDERYGYSFFKYESAIELVNEVRNELNYDLTYFYENKLNKEIVTRKKLEDKEREITLKLEDVKFNISKIKSSMQILGNTKILKEALTNLEKRAGVLDNELLAVKEIQSNDKVKI
jgi:hypothetical protein